MEKEALMITLKQVSTILDGPIVKTQKRVLIQLFPPRLILGVVNILSTSLLERANS